MLSRGDTTVGHGGSVTTLALFSIASRLNRLPVVGTHRRAVVVIGLGLFFDFYEVFLVGVLSTVFLKEFGASRSELPLLLSSAFLGAFLGATALTTLADRIGRRQAFLLTLGIYSVASLAGAFSPTLWFLVAARMVAGFGIGAELPVADSYLADLLPARNRGRYTVWAYTIGFCGIPVAGFLAHSLVGATVIGIPGWRWMFVFGSMGALVIWFLRRRLPESPRWLESVGRLDEAAQIVARLESEAAAKGTIPPPRYDVDPTPPISLRAALSRPSLRRRATMLLIFHPLQSIGYYGFGILSVLILTERGYSVVASLVYAAIIYLGYPLGSLMTVPLIERFDRKWMIVSTGGSMAALGLFYANATNSTSIIIFGFAYTAVSNVFSNSVHVYQGELFPTELRARAAGLPYALSRLSIGIMPFVLVPALYLYGPGWVFSSTGAVLLFAVATIAVLGPPTTGLALEEISSEHTW
ncbi:MAG: MFS transporter [Pseudonocardiales bacterium]|nr:MAG: MFS transporter [Pseudonocardiales bacterium]